MEAMGSLTFTLCLDWIEVLLGLELGPVLGGGSGKTRSGDTKLPPIRDLPEPWRLEILEAVPGRGS